MIDVKSVSKQITRVFILASSPFTIHHSPLPIMSEKLSLLERVKVEGDALRGTIAESIKDELTGAMREEDTLLMKFHGMYQQDDRDRREERAKKKLERLYSFMIRLRMPGGILTSEQWIALNDIAGKIKVQNQRGCQYIAALNSFISSKN